MARLIASANGNFTDAIWSPCSTASELDSEGGYLPLSTSAQDSATFVLAAEEIDAVAVKVAIRVTGTPTNTLTVTLRNTTTSTDVRAVTLNVADLAPCDVTERQGGWYCLVFAPFTPNGTDNYVVRVSVNSTSTQVSLFYSAGPSNWARLVRRTVKVAPVAGDRLLILREHTGPGAGTDRSVVMNNTATTTFGNSTGLSTSSIVSGGAVNAAVVVGKGGTLAWETAASKAYYLKFTGSLVVYSSGILTVGSLAAPIPRSSSAILEVSQATGGDSKFGFCAGATVSICGQSRTAGNNTVWCLLNTDEAVGQTVLGVDRDTGWLSGDDIGIAPTARVYSEGDKRVLASNATSTTLTVSAGLAFAHQGTVGQAQAEVVLLSRNVWLRSDNAARFYNIEARTGAALTFSWVRFQHHGGNSTHAMIVSNTVVEYCSMDVYSSGGGYATTSVAASGWRVEHCVAYNVGVNVAGVLLQPVTTTGWVIDDVVVIGGSYGIVTWGSPTSYVGASITNVRVSGHATGGLHLSISAVAHISAATVVENILARSNSANGININFCLPYKTFRNWTAYRNGSTGITIGQFTGAACDESVFENLTAVGNATVNCQINVAGSVVVRNSVMAGETGFSSQVGLEAFGATGSMFALRVENCTLGGGGGIKTTHTQRDLHLSQANNIPRVTLVACALLSPTRITNAATMAGAGVSEQRPQGLIAGSYTEWYGRGMTAYNTSVVHPPETSSEHLLPAASGAATLRSSPYRAVVRTGEAPIVTVWVYRTAGYSGSFLPRLIVKSNPAVGLNADTVLATMSVGPGVWQQLSASAPVPTENGKMEFAVEVNGATDGVFVGEWSITNATVVGPFYWLDGQPGGDLLGVSDSGDGGGPVGGGATSHVSFG